MPVPHRSTEPGWPRHRREVHPTHWLISTQYEADGVRRLQEDDRGRPVGILALVVLGAARAVVVRARAHLRARLRVDRERLASLVAGPKPSVVLEVLPVEGRHAAALKQVGFHGDADPKSQRQHEDEGVAARRVLRRDEHARDKDHRCVKETGSDHCEHRATDGGTCEVTDTVGD